ncbi:hypothetical protein [Kitasatospora sp. CB01950]|uniref:hypothetical protein n=1 Tax=Kitasatospora sp. CB01950 TaxID=1703930 RepID=UPI00093C83C5|nr:hypothetical protein [Kitasatospora sp. CB01950]OKJ16734.1 hypothetical protein AMK19_00660 [Kitasatospora sp. CB01950]
MTADRISGPGARRLLALPAAAAVALGAAACSDDSSGAGLSYAKVRSTAEQIRQQPSTACPFGLDGLATALQAAGIDRPVTPGAEDAKAVEGELGDGTPPYRWPSGISPSPSTASAPGLPPHAWVTCTWTAGTATVRLDLEAVPLSDVGVSVLLPTLQRTGQLTVDQLGAVVTGRPKPGGKPVLLPGGGLAAIARVPLKGDGDLVLLLSQGDAGPADPALTGEPMAKALEHLQGRIHG